MKFLKVFLHQTHNSLFSIRDKKPKSVLSQVTEFFFFSLFLISSFLKWSLSAQSTRPVTPFLFPTCRATHTSRRQAAADWGFDTSQCHPWLQPRCSDAMSKFFGLLLFTTGVRQHFFRCCYKPVKVLLKWKISPLRELRQSDEVPVWRACAFSARKKWNVSRWRARHIKTGGSILFVFVCILLFTPSREAGISVFFNVWQNSWPLTGMFLKNLAIPQQQVPGFQALSFTSHPFILCTPLQIQHVHWNFFFFHENCRLILILDFLLFILNVM